MDCAHAHEAMATNAQPLGWNYDGWCCNGDGHTGDCQVVSHKAVRSVKGGYQITLEPGDHRLVTKRHVFFKEERAARKSPDGMYHVCLYPTENQLRCFYAPPMGF